MYVYTQERKLFIYGWAIFMFVQQRMNIVPTNSGLYTTTRITTRIQCHICGYYL